MDKLIELAKKELKSIEEKGVLNTSNLEIVSKLADITKDLQEIQEREEKNKNKHEGGQEMYEYGRYPIYREGYRDNGYNYSYREGDYNEGYNRRGVPGSGRGRYNNPMREHMNRMMDGMDQYEYGRERYMHGGDESRVYDGLEKLMYALCMFVESAMDFAETPQEKEIIRKHTHKMSRL